MSDREANRMGCWLGLMLVLLALVALAVRIIASVASKGVPF